MYMDESKRTLDHHIIMWDFDSTPLDSKYLQKIDNMRMKNAPAEKDSDTESEDENAESNRLLVEKINSQSSCCTIFWGRKARNCASGLFKWVTQTE